MNILFTIKMNILQVKTKIILASPIMLLVPFSMVNKFLAGYPLSFQEMRFWCPFLH